MREMIAMLDGIGDLGAYSRAAVSPSQGGNYGGGSSWASSFPTYPSSNGLAGRGLADVLHEAVSGSQGGNYSGGSSWAPGLPTYPSSNGLAAYMEGMAPEERSMMRTVISPGSGELYQGGSSWASGLPLYPSSNGLAAPGARQEWRTYLRVKASDIARGTKLQRLSRTMGKLWGHAAQFCYQPPAAPAAPTLRVVSDVRQLEAAIGAYKAHVLRMAALFGRYINSCSSLPPATVRNLRQAMLLAAQA